MEKTHWTNAEVHKLFRLASRIKSRQTLFNAEERGEIPRAERTLKGQKLVRQWRLDQLPDIGSRYGFLKAPAKQQVLCVYTAKGGVLKTTLSYSLARLLALNGIKTLIVGLDIQCSITELALPPTQVDSLEDAPNNPRLGLYHVLRERAAPEEVIVNTGLPTLDILPETSELNPLEKALRLEQRREYVFQDSLIPQLSAYDVIIFDNGPNWSQLIENALVAAKTIISPIGCDLGTYQALKTNLAGVTEFQRTMKLDWANFLMVPTLLEKTKLSQQIYGAYLNQYANYTIPVPIRRAVKGQEALVMRQTVLEYEATSPLAHDYYELTMQLWDRVIAAEQNTAAA